MSKQRWNCRERDWRTSPQHIEDFLTEYLILCLKHDLCLGHEDNHGGFYVLKYDQETVDWACDASDDT